MEQPVPLSLRPVLVGMNNPIRPNDQRFALYPHPPGCTGARIFDLLCAAAPVMTKLAYIRAFERVNLVDDAMWNRGLARERAAGMHEQWRGTGRVVLLFGEEVRRAFDLPKLLIHPQDIDGVTYRQLPHPSGRNLWYNEAKNRKLASVLLYELYELSAGKCPVSGV